MQKTFDMVKYNFKNKKNTAIFFLNADLRFLQAIGVTSFRSSTFATVKILSYN